MNVRFISVVSVLLLAAACGSGAPPAENPSQQPSPVSTQAGTDPVTNAPPGAPMSPDGQPTPSGGMPTPPSGTPTPPPPGAGAP